MGPLAALPGVDAITVGDGAVARWNLSDSSFRELEGELAVPTLALVNRWLVTSRGWAPTAQGAVEPALVLSDGVVALEFEEARAVLTVFGLHFARRATLDQSTLANMVTGHIDCLAPVTPKHPNKVEVCLNEYAAERQARLRSLPASLRHLTGEHHVVAEFDQPPGDLLAQVAASEQERGRPRPPAPPHASNPRANMERWADRVVLSFVHESDALLEGSAGGHAGVTFLDLAYGSPPRSYAFPVQELKERDGTWTGRLDARVLSANGSPGVQHLSLTVRQLDAAYLYVDWENRDAEQAAHASYRQRFTALIALDSPQRFCWDAPYFQDRELADRYDEKCRALGGQGTR
jgi:hypothetical protein